MARWEGREAPEIPSPRGLEWLRIAARGLFFLGVTLILIVLFALGGLVEKLTGGRPITIPIIRVWGWIGAKICGLRVRTIGTPMTTGGARVMNHSSWVDIIAVLAAAQHFFVAKKEVRSWPVIGWFAEFAGTMFVERSRVAAKQQQAELLARVQTGDKIGFFPEGTSTDGQRVLTFKSTLFAAFMDPSVIEDMWVQPVTVFYTAPKGELPYFYGWWGEMSFGAHLLHVLGRGKGAVATISFHQPVCARDFADRKALAVYCEAEVRKGHDHLLSLGAERS